MVQWLVGQMTCRNLGRVLCCSKLCNSNPFTPPRNMQRSLEYISYKEHYEQKEQWEVKELRRAVVTYEFSVRVTRLTAFITNEDTRVVIPNLVAFTRTNDKI